MMQSNGKNKWVPRINPQEKDCLGTFKGDNLEASSSIALLPHVQGLIIGEANGSLYMVDLRTGSFLWKNMDIHEPILQTVSTNRSGEIVATGADDGYVCLWNSQNGALINKLFHPASITAISFSPKGEYFAVACCDNNIYIRETESGNILTTCVGHEAWPETVSWSTTVDRVVSGSNDFTLRFWDYAKGTEEQIIDFGTKVLSVDWSNENGNLAVGGGNGRVIVFHPSEEGRYTSFLGHNDEVNCVRFNAKGQFLATGGDDQSVRLWDVKSGEELHKFQFEEPFVWNISWSPNNAFLVVSFGGDCVKLIDIRKYI
jgi:WD40 repeat protein